MSDHSVPSLPKDIASAYLAASARIGSWVVVSAIVFRSNPEAFAMLALMRSTIGLLSYTSLGLAPAMIHSLARIRPSQIAVRVIPVEDQTPQASTQLAYAGTSVPKKLTDINDGLRTLLASGIGVAVMAALLGLALVWLYAANFDRIHSVPPWLELSGPGLAAVMGVAMVIRLASDAPSAVLQTENRITLDNFLVVVAEIVWVGLTWVSHAPRTPVLGSAVLGFLASSVVLFYARIIAADRRTKLPPMFWKFFDWETAAFLIKTGSLIAAAQLADFLYAPTDYILINRLLDPLTVATYAPAVQIDAALLVLVSGLAAVLLPKTAVAHAGGEIATVRAYYVRGTIASFTLLLLASICVLATAPDLFRVWLGDSMPATRAILPLVLIHTVIGGSSAVGRSILLGLGKVKPFAISALLAGATNVILSIIFVTVFKLGLRGIILGTIIAVTLRCAVWMPWYVMRVIRRGEATDESLATASTVDVIA